MGLRIHPGLKCGGDREARHRKQRANWGRSRDNRIISCALARTLNPLQGGSASRTTEMPSKLQLMQQFVVTTSEEGKSIRSLEDQAIYVGISNPTNRLADDDVVKMQKKEKSEKEGEPSVAGMKQLNKIPRLMKDGLLLVVTARINGHPVRTMIDSGATRCFVTPACVTAVGLKGKPQDTFLELGNGQKFLSRGLAPDVLVVTTSLIVRVGLTITSLLHEVDLVLGVNWL